jgi:CBS domain-containing protein/flavin-binding protein dodecin
MTPNPIIVPPDIYTVAATTIMADKGIGNLVVAKDSAGPAGILTEREIIQYLSLNRQISNLPLKAILPYQSFSSVSPDTTIFDAANTMISMKARLLVFDNNDRLVGIITASDMVRAFTKTSKNPSLEHAMNKKIFDVQFNDTILAAVKLMDSENIGSVIVNDKNSTNKRKKPYGIFTERDLLTKILLKNIDLDAKVGDYSSTPLITAPIETHANDAAKIMASNNIKRLPLTKEGRLVAMVTARDLVEAFSTDNEEVPSVASVASVAKIVEIIGTSEKGWQEAAQVAVNEAAKTISGIHGIEVVDQTAQVDAKTGKIIKYKTCIKVSFGVEHSPIW